MALETPAQQYFETEVLTKATRARAGVQGQQFAQVSSYTMFWKKREYRKENP